MTNDENIDINQDEFQETEGGNWKMTIDISDDTIDSLIDSWVCENCNLATLEQYEEVRDETKSRSEALYSAIVNEIIIKALEAQIEREAAELNVEPQDI